MGALGPSAPDWTAGGRSLLAGLALPLLARYPSQAPPLSLASGLSAHVNYQASASGRCHLHV